MEKSSNIVLSEAEKSQIRGDILPERFVGWYSLEELKEMIG